MGQHIHQAAYQPGMEITGRRTCGQDALNVHEYPGGSKACTSTIMASP